MSVNPLKEQRELLGLTQEELADRCMISRDSVVKYEAGLLTNPSWDILAVLYEKSLEKHNAIDNYYKWQVEIRKTHVDKLRAALKLYKGGPFKDFRLLVSDSQIGFCKLYCIHPQVLRTFEKGQHRNELSDQLRKVFLDAGLTWDEIYDLEEKLAK